MYLATNQDASKWKSWHIFYELKLKPRGENRIAIGEVALSTVHFYSFSLCCSREHVRNYVVIQAARMSLSDCHKSFDANNDLFHYLTNCFSILG